MADWGKAEEYLDKCEKAYKAIGTAGYLICEFVLTPLRDRLNKGEQSDELWKEIMEAQL
jgi:hypothetical protein